MMCNGKYCDAKSIIYYKKGDKQTPQIKIANSTISKATGIGNITIPITLIIVELATLICGVCLYPFL